MTAKLAIILVLYRSRDELAPLWDCLHAQEFADWRLIAVDNSPEDGGGDFLAARGDARVTVIRSAGNVGFARGVNAGLRIALADGAPRCLLLNPDVEFTPDFLAALMASWDANAAEVMAPRVMYHDDPQRSWYAGGHLDFGWTFSNKHDIYRPGGPGSRIVDFASGCCLGMTQGVLRRIGLLDESFFVYWEDTDFCLRLKAAGVPIHYAQEPFLLHHAAASSGGEQSAAALRLYFRGYVVLLRKHFPPLVALRMMARTLVKEATRQGRPHRYGWLIASSMLRGLVTRLRAVPMPAAGPDA